MLNIFVDTFLEDSLKFDE